jgi:hypothetical protein
MEQGKCIWALNQCSRSTSSYNPPLVESVKQNTPISLVDIVPLPKRKGQQRIIMGKES